MTEADLTAIEKRAAAYERVTTRDLPDVLRAYLADVPALLLEIRRLCAWEADMRARVEADNRRQRLLWGEGAPEDERAESRRLHAAGLHSAGCPAIPPEPSTNCGCVFLHTRECQERGVGPCACGAGHGEGPCATCDAPSGPEAVS